MCLQTYPLDEMNKLMAESDDVLAALPHTADTHLLINAEAVVHQLAILTYLVFADSPTQRDEQTDGRE